VILGAGFGGLELATCLSETIADEVRVTLIDRDDSFFFGFSKLEVMLGRESAEEIKLPYREFQKDGVEFRQEAVTGIDPAARRVRTDGGSYDADFVVVALGADYDFAATPGLAGGGNEFYTAAGAERLAEIVPTFSAGRVVIGVCGAPYKCPPAPSECALLLHDALARRGVRDRCEITLVLPFQRPIPPSPDSSAALLEAFEERDIRFVASTRVGSVDTGSRTLTFQDGGELQYDLFLGVPQHRAPRVVVEAGMTVDGYIPVDTATLETRWPDVYAIGDVATQGTPKAGVFSEGAARALGTTLVNRLRGSDETGTHAGTGSCYIEFGAGRIGRVDIDFLSAPSPTGTFRAPSAELRAEKDRFGSTRRARWFGRTG
jgi:sulfide:quinone oxidoreductase